MRLHDHGRPHFIGHAGISWCLGTAGHEIGGGGGVRAFGRGSRQLIVIGDLRETLLESGGTVGIGRAEELPVLVARAHHFRATRAGRHRGSGLGAARTASQADNSDDDDGEDDDRAADGASDQSGAVSGVGG